MRPCLHLKTHVWVVDWRPREALTVLPEPCPIGHNPGRWMKQTEGAALLAAAAWVARTSSILHEKGGILIASHLGDAYASCCPAIVLSRRMWDPSASKTG